MEQEDTRPAPRAAASEPPGVQNGRLPTDDIPTSGESTREILRLPHGRVELISSAQGVRSDQFVQDDNEWVVVLSGRGVVRVSSTDGPDTDYPLQAGEWLYLPAGTPHRVIDTAEGTRWLAFHIRDDAGEDDAR